MSDRITVASDQDVVRVRQLVRTVAVAVKLSLVDQTTRSYLDNHADPDARLQEAVALIAGLVSLGGRMLLQLAQRTELSEDEILRIMGQRIAYRT